MSVCMIEGCELPSKARGLCFNCYQAARNAVNNGRVTWDVLIENCLALDTTRGGSNSGAFEKAMASKIPGAAHDSN